MTEKQVDRDQLRRILQLALLSPYEGERAKAAARLLRRLSETGLSLNDLDTSFDGIDQETQLKRRANLPYSFHLDFKSNEEALLFEGLVKILSTDSLISVEGHRVECFSSDRTKERALIMFERHAPSLQTRLANAQKEAMREYNTRRRDLFLGAITAELREVETPPV